MATTVTIQVSALSASRTFQNDAKAQATLLAFYLDENLGPTNATNQQKLLAVVDWFTKYVSRRAVLRARRLADESAEPQAITDYEFQ